MNKKHVMIDLETWGQDSNSVIVQLSAVQFDMQTGQYGSTFNMYIDPNSSVKHGLHIEPSTIIWWMIQSDAARTNMINSVNRSIGSNTLPVVLSEFSRWFKENCDTDTIVWGRGPRFDFGLLKDSYNAIGLSIPWNFRNEMCVRTMEWLRPLIKQSTKPVDMVGHGSEGGGMHNGIIDALYQIKYVSAIYNALNDRTRLRQLVDDTVNFYTESTTVMSTTTNDELINKVFPELKDIPGNHF